MLEAYPTPGFLAAKTRRITLLTGAVRREPGLPAKIATTLDVLSRVSRSRPRISRGGSGEQKTLRLVAKHAASCSLSGGP